MQWPSITEFCFLFVSTVKENYTLDGAIRERKLRCLSFMLWLFGFGGIIFNPLFLCWQRKSEVGLWDNYLKTLNQMIAVENDSNILLKHNYHSHWL